MLGASSSSSSSSVSVGDGGERVGASHSSFPHVLHSQVVLLMRGGELKNSDVTSISVTVPDIRNLTKLGLGSESGPIY